MNFEGSIRETIPLEFGDEKRHLKVTFGLMDRVRRHVKYEGLALQISEMAVTKDVSALDLTSLVKFIALNLKEAGFDIGDEELNQIYDEIFSSEDATNAYIAIASRILMAYTPKGKAGKKPQAPKAKTKAK